MRVDLNSEIFSKFPFDFDFRYSYRDKDFTDLIDAYIMEKQSRGFGDDGARLHRLALWYMPTSQRIAILES